MIELTGLAIVDDDGLTGPELAPRCRCDRPLVMRNEDGRRCLKCGRTPTIRLTAIGELSPEPLSIPNEKGRERARDRDGSWARPARGSHRRRRNRRAKSLAS